MVKTPPANAGDMGSIPGPGRFHTQLSLCTQILSQRSRAYKPQLLSPHDTRQLKPSHPRALLRNKRSRRSEGQPPLSTTRESPCTVRQTQRSQK